MDTRALTGRFRSSNGPTVMHALLRASLIAFACAGLSACGGLGIGLWVMAGGADAERAQQLVEDRLCRESGARGVAIGEPADAAIPDDEGKVETFGPVFWRPSFHLEGFPDREPERPAVGGTLALTGQAILFVPRPRAPGVRIPYEAVLDVDPSPKSGVVVIVHSVCSRFDIFTFWQGPPSAADPEAAKVAMATIKARLAAIR